MAQVFYADDDQSMHTARWSESYQYFPDGVGLKLGLEQLFRFNPIGDNALYRKSEVAKNQERSVILDAKLFGTPNTMRRAVREIMKLNTVGFTVAIESGIASLRAAIAARDEFYAAMPTETRPAKKPVIFGVPVLSSRSDEDCVNGGPTQGAWHRETARLVRKAQKNGIDGIVCSSFGSLTFVRRVWPQAIILATSVRPEWATWVKNEDQQQYILPSDILKWNIEYAVAGRAVSDAPDPSKALERFCLECNHSV